MTASTRVCCNMISDSHTRYGLGSLRHGMVLADRWYQFNNGSVTDDIFHFASPMLRSADNSEKAMKIFPFRASKSTINKGQSPVIQRSGGGIHHRKTCVKPAAYRGGRPLTLDCDSFLKLQSVFASRNVWTKKNTKFRVFLGLYGDIRFKQIKFLICSVDISYILS